MKKFWAFVLATLSLSGCASSSTAWDSIRDGGEWFLNNQNENFLYYEYSTTKSLHPDTSHAMREMGALWAVYHLADFLDDDRYDALAQKGLDYFKESLEEDPQNGFLFVNITPEKVKLGYSAFMILNLLESEDPDKDELMRQLAEGILFAQEDDGSLDTFFYSDRSTGVDYYPGEALLALMSLYEYTGDSTYLDAVTKALPYYEAYFEENPNSAFVPWQTQAYVKYYQATGSEEAVDFVFKMNDYLLNVYSPGKTCSPDLTSAASVAAVYTEGMNKAYGLALVTEDEDRQNCYARFIQSGVKVTMDLQYPMEGQSGEDPVAFGGFAGSSKDLSQRVDRNQHGVMALMGAYELGLVK